MTHWPTDRLPGVGRSGTSGEMFVYRVSLELFTNSSRESRSPVYTR
jgi:hypothetical protein